MNNRSYSTTAAVCSRSSFDMGKSVHYTAVLIESYKRKGLTEHARTCLETIFENAFFAVLRTIHHSPGVEEERRMINHQHARCVWTSPAPVYFPAYCGNPGPA